MSVHLLTIKISQWACKDSAVIVKCCIDINTFLQSYLKPYVPDLNEIVNGLITGILDTIELLEFIITNDMKNIWSSIAT